jgi:predicted DNA-binding transcriptional regulator YafY
MGKGNWDANTLAAELECSKRTIYRLLQSLSLAGIPWHFDESCRAYRVRPGFKFPIVEQAAKTPEPRTENLEALQPLIEKLISDGKAFSCSLQQVLDSLQNL